MKLSFQPYAVHWLLCLFNGPLKSHGPFLQVVSFNVTYVKYRNFSHFLYLVNEKNLVNLLQFKCTHIKF